MYNGIGLQTPRGSGSSGYVQMNKFNARSRPKRDIPSQRDLDNGSAMSESMRKGGNRDILEHEQRRAIEVKIFELRAKLEDEGVDR